MFDIMYNLCICTINFEGKFQWFYSVIKKYEGHPQSKFLTHPTAIKPFIA